MLQRVARPLLALTLPLLLFGCGSGPQPGAGDEAVPWTDTAPATLRPQALTPGMNTLQYERVLSATNGYGPVEKNRSNGERAAGDGKTLTLNGKTYPQGYGVHANSELRFSLKGQGGAQCTRFTVDIGVDDEVGEKGSVVFWVYLDGRPTYYSDLMTGSSPTQTLDLDISGKRDLRLVVTDADNGVSSDHADWADPKIFCVSSVQDASKLLDPSFGQGGQAAFRSDDVALGADGSFYGVSTENENIVLRRRRPDGSVTQVTGGVSGVATGSVVAVKVQPDGKVVVVGTRNRKFAVLRFNADLTSDSTFGSGGQVVTDLGGVPGAGQIAYDVAVQPDGKLVVVGEVSRAVRVNEEFSVTVFDFALVRYLPDGTLDGSFGDGGKTTTGFEAPDNLYNEAVAKAVALQPDGKIVVVGDIDCNGAVLARYNADGRLDTSFAGDGSFGGAGEGDSCGNYEAFNALAVGRDGRIVVAGWVKRNADSAWVLRFTPQGRLEAQRAFRFVETGYTVLNPLSAVLLQDDGKIVVGGHTYSFGPGANETFGFGYAVARLNPDLTLDAAFGGRGTGTATFGIDDSPAGFTGDGRFVLGIHSLLRQPDGKILALGRTTALRLRP